MFICNRCVIVCFNPPLNCCVSAATNAHLLTNMFQNVLERIALETLLMPFLIMLYKRIALNCFTRLVTSPINIIILLEKHNKLYHFYGIHTFASVKSY